MKTKFIYLVVLFLISSCYKEDINVNLQNNPAETPTVRLAGDGNYDVLGMGYDVTDDYLNPMSVRSPVLDINKYIDDHSERLITGTSSFGYDKFYYGFSAKDYTEKIIETDNVGVNLGINKKEEKEYDLFSGNFTSNNYFSSEYSYSSKYSFASLDIVRNVKYIRINDEVQRLSEYLSTSFLEDLDRLTPDRLVERYGTHVLTDFVIGGRYRLIYRSSIQKITDNSIKKETIKSGFNATIARLGLSVNSEEIIETNSSLVKENNNTELYVMTFAGNGSNIKYDLEKGYPSTIDIASWEESIDLNNANITSITWKETYPIYEFIPDSIKKNIVKDAVFKYIESKKINILPLVPFYQYYDGRDHYYTTVYYPNGIGGWKYEGVNCYVFSSNIPEENTVPLYQYYDGGYHYYSTVHYPNGIGGWKLEGIICFVKITHEENTIPLYQYYDGKDHYYSTVYYPNGIGGWKYEGIVCYVYQVG